jgi:hypothetical protein
LDLRFTWAGAAKLINLMFTWPGIAGSRFTRAEIAVLGMNIWGVNCFQYDFDIRPT